MGDVWMPTKLKEIIAASTGAPNRVTVYETEVLKIEAGTVRPKDLVIVFPEGTEVVDAIQGVTYKTDANGDPLGTVEGLIGARPTVPVPYVAVAKSSRLGLLLFAVGGMVVFVTVVMYFVRRAKVRG